MHDAVETVGEIIMKNRYDNSSMSMLLLCADKVFPDNIDCGSA